MFIELLFATTLDMSMPEFQPMVDISGNVVVSEIEDVSGDIIAAEIPIDEIPLEETSERSLQGLSLEAEPTEEVIVKKNNSLRNGNTITLESEVLANRVISTYNMQIRSSTGRDIYYIYLEANKEYTLNNISTIYFSYSLDVYSTIYTVNYSSTFTPEQNCYLLKQDDSFTVSYSTGDLSGDEPGGDVSGDEPGGDTPSIEVDLSTVENKIDKLIVLGRSLLFVLIVNFCYPLIISIFNNIGGGRDV